GEIAISHFGSWDAIIPEGALTQLESLIVEEPERAVLPVVEFRDGDWPTDRAAEFVADQLGRRIREVIAIPRDAVAVVPVGLKERAIQSVCSPLSRHDKAALSGESRRSGVHLHMELLNAVEARQALNTPPAIQLVGQGGAIEDDVEGSDARAENT